MKKYKLAIDGMHCEKCTQRVAGALEKLGAKEITVNLEGKFALLSGDYSQDALKDTVEGLGFDVLKVEEL